VSRGPTAGDATSTSRAASLERKEATLDLALRELPSLLVAYSGGVDSAYLAYAAHRALAANLLCVTADSPSYPERHRAIARRIAEQFGFNHLVIQTEEMAPPSTGQTRRTAAISASTSSIRIFRRSLASEGSP